jgi:hypothetical protein
LRDLMGQLKAERQEWRVGVQVCLYYAISFDMLPTTSQAEASVKYTDLRGMMEKREADLTRLRGLRDALTADLNERKARDTERDGSLNQSKILASARGVRVYQGCVECTHLQ